MKSLDHIQVIGFDADDTLWENAAYFVRAEKRLAALLSDYIGAEELHQTLVDIETNNMQWYGYGVMAYTLSLIETATQTGHNQLNTSTISDILQIGKDMLAQEIELKEHVESVLQCLQKHYRLIMITKGDPLDQERKLRKSGLESYFHHIEIVTEKDEQRYLKLLRQLDIQPRHFLMIGNSIKSDVAPVLAIGSNAIHYHIGNEWEYERIGPLKAEYPVIHDLSEIPGLLGWQI